MEPPVVAALIAVGGTLFGLVVRELVISINLAAKERRLKIDLLSQQRQHQLEDKALNDRERRQDIVRRYGDPLFRSLQSLEYRFKELLEQPGRADYLLSDSRYSEYDHYKFMSTLYRFSLTRVD